MSEAASVLALTGLFILVRWAVGPPFRVYDLRKSTLVSLTRKDRALPKTPIVRNWKAYEKKMSKGDLSLDK